MRDARAVMLPMVLALPALAGCVPPAVTVASYVADGASYAVSEKSVSDHGLSAVKHQNCATWHFFVGRAVCEDKDNPLPTAPLDEHRGDGTVKHADGFTRKPPPVAVASEAAAAQDSSDQDPGVYLVVGSFIDRANAERLAARYPAYHPQLVAATVDGRAFARVVLGPLDAAQRAALQAEGVSGLPLHAPRQPAISAPLLAQDMPPPID